jgi:hypothetical protein
MRALKILLIGAVVSMAVGAGVAWSAAARAIPRCQTSDLTVTLKPAGAGAGSIFQSIVFRNHTSHSCTLRGYPGVSYVAGSSGRQVGPAAGRVAAHIHTVVLAPGGRAHAGMREGNYQNYPTSACQPRHVRGLRVYPPNTRAAVFLPWSHRVCSKNVGQASVKPVRHGG